MQTTGILKKFVFFVTAVGIFSGLFPGCAALRPSKDTIQGRIEKPTGREDLNWWYARFRWHWPSGQDDPNWYLDIFLAHRVMKTVVKQFEPELKLWRFHRRAIRDRAGHQFSFIFYSTRETAARLYDVIEQDATVENLKLGGLLEKTVFDSLDTETPPRPKIEDTSDKNWPMAVQKSWPYFIEGVSRMWIGLIDQIVAESGQEPQAYLPIEELEPFYLEVERSVQKIWRRKGYHAFLHHLNAIFGYEPLIIYEKRLMKF